MNQPDVRQFLCVTHKIFFKCPYSSSSTELCSEQCCVSRSAWIRTKMTELGSEIAILVFQECLGNFHLTTLIYIC